MLAPFLYEVRVALCLAYDTLQSLGPVAVSIDRYDRVYVGDSDNQRVQVFDNSGNFIFAFGSGGNAEGEFDRPLGIAIDLAGRIWVSEFNNSRIQVFDDAGGFEFMIGWGVATGASAFEVCTAGCRTGLQGGGDGQFHMLLGLTHDGRGRVYSTDFANHRIQVFRSLAASAQGGVGEVEELEVSREAGPARLSWIPQPITAGEVVRYDVLSGELSEVRSVGNFGGATSIADELAASTFDDPGPDPGPGMGTYYLVGARNACELGPIGDSSLEPDPRDELDTPR